MAGRKYSTWVEVTGTDRKGQPKFGSNNDMSLDIYVGYGASDSTLLATVKVVKTHDDGFLLRVDDHSVASVDSSRTKYGIEDWLEFLSKYRGV